MIFIAKAKGGARPQPMTGRLATYLGTYIASLPKSDIPKSDSWLFPSGRAKSGHIEDPRRFFCRALSAAGLDRGVITPHVMRHTAITHAMQANVELTTVKKISGHKTLAMVERYAHANAAHVRAAMDKLEARMTKAA